MNERERKKSVRRIKVKSMKIADYEFLDDRLYDKEHVWYKKEGEGLRIGVSDFFQKMANEIVFVELPAPGRVLETGKPFASIESGKWVGRIKSVIEGKVVGANGELGDFPYLLNDSPYDEGWLIDIVPSNEDYASVLFDLSDPSQVSEFESFLRSERQRIADLTK
jgi:glycine cleavage system H protein